MGAECSSRGPGLTRSVCSDASSPRPSWTRRGDAGAPPDRAGGRRLANVGPVVYKNGLPGETAVQKLDTRDPSFAEAWAASARADPTRTRRPSARRRTSSCRTFAREGTPRSSSTPAGSTGGSRAGRRPREGRVPRGLRRLPAEGRRALKLAAKRIADFHRRERDAECRRSATRSARRSPRWSGRSRAQASTCRAARRVTRRRCS